MKLMDKDALVAEIEKRQSIVLDPLNNNIHTKRLEETYKSILSFINTLEVKEVDLEKEINLWFDYGFPNDEELLDYIKETARHFYELGLKAQKGE